jgi:hypothetical protein
MANSSPLFIQFLTLSGETRKRLATSATVRPAAISRGIVGPLFGLAGTLKQGVFDRFYVAEEFGIGPQTGYPASLGFGPQPFEGHAEPPCRDVKGNKLGWRRVAHAAHSIRTGSGATGKEAAKKR